MIDKALTWAEDHWGVLGAFMAMLITFGRWNWSLRDEVKSHGNRLSQLEEYRKEDKELFREVFEKVDENTKAVHELIGEMRGRKGG